MYCIEKHPQDFTAQTTIINEIIWATRFLGNHNTWKFFLSKFMLRPNQTPQRQIMQQDWHLYCKYFIDMINFQNKDAIKKQKLMQLNTIKLQCIDVGRPLTMADPLGSLGHFWGLLEIWRYHDWKIGFHILQKKIYNMVLQDQNLEDNTDKLANLTFSIWSVMFMSPSRCWFWPLCPFFSLAKCTPFFSLNDWPTI